MTYQTWNLDHSIKRSDHFRLAIRLSPFYHWHHHRPIVCQQCQSDVMERGQRKPLSNPFTKSWLSEMQSLTTFHILSPKAMVQLISLIYQNQPFIMLVLPIYSDQMGTFSTPSRPQCRVWGMICRVGLGSTVRMTSKHWADGKCHLHQITRSNKSSSQ